MADPDAYPAVRDPAIGRMIERAIDAARAGHAGAAVELFQSALRAEPALPVVWYEYGFALKSAGRNEEALDAYARSIALGLARREEAHVNRAVILSDFLRRDDDAEAELRAALTANPDYLPALLNLGNLFEERGRREDALAVYATAREVGRSGRGGRDSELALEALARCARLVPPDSVDDPMVAELRQAAATPASIIVRANVLFALGQTFDRLGDFDAAFDAFAKANRWLLRGSGRVYDPARTEAHFGAVRGAFARPAVREPEAIPGPRPLFICGMFRSGSTLIEQVLASHPDVTAGGELVFLQRLASERFAPWASVAHADAAEDERSARDYREHLAALFPQSASSKYVTDKRPDNFVLIGLIKRLFPDARIVHTVRSPADNGLSVFMQHLHLQVAPYSADLADIGHYYGQYRELMRHWSALYPESIYDFDYDAFVQDPRGQLSGLLEFLGLAWDERCLEFHRLDNTVKTASYWQVRQPLNTKAVGRWQRYEKHLGPLLTALGPYAPGAPTA